MGINERHFKNIVLEIKKFLFSLGSLADQINTPKIININSYLTKNIALMTTGYAMKWDVQITQVTSQF